VRILCLGNNTEDTDRCTRYLADNQHQLCHGLLSELEGPLPADSYQLPGFYHSSVYDIEFGRLLTLANQFDQVWMLDQLQDSWSHPNSFFLTVRLVELMQHRGRFLNPSHKNSIGYFSQLVQQNKSFCIFPFIELLVYDQHTTVCCRSTKPVSSVKNLDFANDKNYLDIRSKMLSGEMIPEHCSSCYRLEQQNLPSARTQETVEWANRLGLKNVDDLKTLVKPTYYEVRASNKCNLQCRMCGPSSSHLIDQEYRTLGLVAQNKPLKIKHTAGFEIVDFDNLKKLYVSGGEPTIMPELYTFLDKCIAQNKTDFELVINTNGTKLSDKFLDRAQKFKNLQFIFSIDGFGDLNHYIRWPSCWTNIVDNWNLLRSRGHQVTVNTTVSIYNISNLHLLYQFIDANFPKTLVHCQIVEDLEYLSPWLFPDSELAISSLTRVLDTDCCKNDLLFHHSIQGYIKILNDRQKIDSVTLSKFFHFNDLLDASRNICLANYIPELENYRKCCSLR
jgi:hypothetical protein